MKHKPWPNFRYHGTYITLFFAVLPRIVLKVTSGETLGHFHYIILTTDEEDITFPEFQGVFNASGCTLNFTWWTYLTEAIIQVFNYSTEIPAFFMKFGIHP